MNNTEKKLDALIDALGFDVEGQRTSSTCSCRYTTGNGCEKCNYLGVVYDKSYKLTKRVNNKSQSDSVRIGNYLITQDGDKIAAKYSPEELEPLDFELNANR